MTKIDFPVFLAVWNRLQGQTTPALHFQIATWLADGYRQRDERLLLMAFRNSGKSTIVGLFAAWLLTCDPERRLLILSADHQLAVKMTRTVRRILERHPLAQNLLPDKAEEWAADRLTVARRSGTRDPSLLAKGIGANLTGARADVVICDDVEVPNTCDSAEKRRDLRARLDEIDFVLSPGGMALYVGTPHTRQSIYAEAASTATGQEGCAYLADARRLVLPAFTADGSSRWPARFSPERLQAMRTRAGPAKFMSQMMLQPQDETDMRLDPARLVPYDAALTYNEGNGHPVLSIDGVRMVSASCFWDPSFGRAETSDGCAIAVVFADADGTRWVHDVRYLTIDPAITPDIDEATQLCRQAGAFVRAHFVPAVMIETNGLGRFLPGLFRSEIRRAHLACAVIEHTSRQNKAARILEAFDALLAAGRVRAHHRVLAGRFADELRDWRPGGTSQDDGIDAVAGCLLAEAVRFAGAPRALDSRARSLTDWRPGGDPVRVSLDFDV